MKKLTLFLLTLTILFGATSCDRRIAKIFPNRPDQEFGLSDITPDFKVGFDDGCESGMAAGSNTFYKMFYRSNKIDGYKFTNSGDYKSAWGIGWWYCYRYDYVKQKQSLYGSFFKGHY